MKTALVTMEDKFYLNKRGVIESVIDILKSICDIDHTRHRSPLNAIIHILGGVAAYHFLDQKPSIYSRTGKLTAFIPKLGWKPATLSRTHVKIGERSAMAHFSLIIIYKRREQSLVFWVLQLKSQDSIQTK